MLRVKDIRELFKESQRSAEYTEDRNGGSTIELLGASFLADEPAIFGSPNQTYIQSEIDWYNSQSTNINDIYEDAKPPPAAWLRTANAHGEINSNYGHLIFSEKYFNQFTNAICELVANPDSRRAQMVYNRPSIWNEFDENGKSDFICTNAQTMYIRDNKLHMVSQMRSNDVYLGYRNDYAWAKYIMGRAVEHIEDYASVVLEVGDLHWQVMNMHLYEKHYHLIGA